jgi:hypothetical protein
MVLARRRRRALLQPGQSLRLTGSAKEETVENQLISVYDPDDDPTPYEAMIIDLSKREVSTRARRQLAELYIDAYRRTILDRVDFPYRLAMSEGRTSS